MADSPRWPTAAIFKIGKSPYLGNSSTRVQEMWRDDAQCTLTAVMWPFV